MAHQFTKGGQTAWFHDHGHGAGFFHTYDELKVGGWQDEPRKVHVFLPRDYESSQQRYPVIYMNDGQTAFFPGGAAYKSWQMAEALSHLYHDRTIRPVIVVAIHPLNRDREYTHAPVLDHACCGLPDYAHYVAHPVKNFIDQHYRTIADPHHTMIMGSSHGGLTAFYIGTHYADRIGLVAALSSSFWVGLDSRPMGLPFVRSLSQSELMQSVRKTLQNSEKRLKIYLDWGLVRSGGWHNGFIEERATVRGREMQKILINEWGYKIGEDLFVVEDPKGDHTEETWARRLPNILKLFFAV
ncbi:MAG: alpha/beta hydrolase-fold protein [Synechococcales bacterium]|nr:alpha/beta hydrolase-fold protein [Synechococcales bacterium]